MIRALAVPLLALAACHPGATSSSPTRPSRGHVEAPKGVRLVVLVIVEHLPEWTFEAKRPLLERGFARLLRDGDWRLGVQPSLGFDDTGFLRVSGAAVAGAKAVAVNLRAAPPPLGAHGLALDYDANTGTWQSHGAPTPWLARYTADHPIATYLAPWTPLDPAMLAQQTGTVDAQPGEVGARGFGPTFPHDPATTKAPFNAVLAMPAGNDMVLDMATAAVANEKLGRDDTPDLLIVSLPAHDDIARGWGHESWEALDAELRLDARLDAFLSSLDTQVGADHWSMIVTSDHGGAPLPERTGGGRITEEQIERAANAAATTALGPGSWIANATQPYVHLSAAALQQDKKPLANAYKKIVFALRSFPGLALADRTDQYAGNCDARTGDARAVCLAIDPARAGQFIFAPARNWIIERDGERGATGHGSLNDYDREVPVILLPHGRNPHAAQTAPAGAMSLADVAPLVASWLGSAWTSSK